MTFSGINRQPPRALAALVLAQQFHTLLGLLVLQFRHLQHQVAERLLTDLPFRSYISFT